VFEAPALVSGFDDLAMMGEAVEERGCHLGVAEHAPLAAGVVMGDLGSRGQAKPLLKFLADFRETPDFVLAKEISSAYSL
jgi:hypothetical protein